MSSIAPLSPILTVLTSHCKAFSFSRIKLLKNAPLQLVCHLLVTLELTSKVTTVSSNRRGTVYPSILSCATRTVPLTYATVNRRSFTNHSVQFLRAIYTFLNFIIQQSTCFVKQSPVNRHSLDYSTLDKQAVMQNIVSFHYSSAISSHQFSNLQGGRWLLYLARVYHPYRARR